MFKLPVLLAPTLRLRCEFITVAPKPVVMSLLVLAAAIATAGCSKHPELVCVNPTVQQSVQGLFFSAADQQIDGNVADNPMVDWTTVKRNLQSLKADHLFSITAIVFKGLDKETKIVRCGADVQILLPQKYKSAGFISTAAFVKNSATPADLFGDHPSVGITYTIQPQATGKGYVISADGIAPLSATLIVLATTEWQTARSQQMEDELRGVQKSVPAKPKSRTD